LATHSLLFTDIQFGNVFRESAKLHGGFTDKKCIFKYVRVSKLGAMLISFLQARGHSILFG